MCLVISMERARQAADARIYLGTVRLPHQIHKNTSTDNGPFWKDSMKLVNS